MMDGRGRAARRLATVMLMLMLCVFSCMGARNVERVPVAALPVTRVEMAGGSMCTLEQVQQRLDAQRRDELTLLDEVIAAGADAQIQNDALRQKAEIVLRMEHEAQAGAILSSLGILQHAVCSGAGCTTVFLSEAHAGDMALCVRMVEAIASATGLDAASIKIILAKNQT